MGIKRTCLDEYPPGHPKMFERTPDTISLFVLAISDTISFVVVVVVVCFLFLVLFPVKTLGK